MSETLAPSHMRALGKAAQKIHILKTNSEPKLKPSLCIMIIRLGASNVIYIYTHIHWRPTYQSLIWPFAVYAKRLPSFPNIKKLETQGVYGRDMVAMGPSRGNDKAETKFTDISFSSLMESLSLDAQHTRQHKRTRKCEVGGSYESTRS